MAIRETLDSMDEYNTIKIAELDPEGRNEVKISIAAGRARVEIVAGQGEVAVRTSRLEVIGADDEDEFKSEVQVLSQINEA